MTVSTPFPSITLLFTTFTESRLGISSFFNLFFPLQIVIICTSSLLRPCPPKGNISHIPCHGHHTWQRQNSGSWQSAAAPNLRLHLPPPPNSQPATLLSFAVTQNPSAQTAPEDVIHEVALKAIPKKRIKGNEENVWSETRVLDHPDIVRPISPHSFSSSCACILVCLLTLLVVFP